MKPSANLKFVKDSSTTVYCTKSRTKIQVLNIFLWKLLKNRHSGLKFCVVFKAAALQDVPCLLKIVGNVFRPVPVGTDCDHLSSQFPVAPDHIRMRMAEAETVLESGHIHLNALSHGNHFFQNLVQDILISSIRIEALLK